MNLSHGKKQKPRPRMRYTREVKPFLYMVSIFLLLCVMFSHTCVFILYAMTLLLNVFVTNTRREKL